MANDDELKRKINEIFNKSNNLIKDMVGDDLFSLFREFAADILEETEKKVKFNKNLTITTLCYALGGAFFVMRISPKDQNKWFDLVSLVYQNYEDLRKASFQDNTKETSSTFLNANLNTKKDKSNN